jgi:quinol monooxygenase YgiN
MVSIHVTLTVRNQSDVTTVRELLAEHARRSRAEPGCLKFEAYQSNLDPHAFFLVEAWESREALDVHRQAEAFTTIYGPKVIPLVDRAAHETTPLAT